MDEDLYFSEYKMFTDYEIDEITVQGIRFKNGMRIDFTACSETWAKMYSVPNMMCVGNRDHTCLRFEFYTLPTPTVIQFLRKGRLRETFSKNNARHRFHMLQFKIIELGYKTYDLS